MKKSFKMGGENRMEGQRWILQSVRWRGYRGRMNNDVDSDDEEENVFPVNVPLQGMNISPAMKQSLLTRNLKLT